ncbi:unnamed protein product [Lymnaea stagnalis]|uniref:Centromere protein S n=1 Tax=Lymnaea stagnalis TaxID=6523 RepID=A0AAV2HN68_LYMST
MNEDQMDISNTENVQSCKAALYYSIKQISKEVEEEMDVTISPQVLATVSESLHRQIECYALDLENFAKHAKRTNVNVDDVKLIIRRNDTLFRHLSEMAADQTATNKRGSKKSTSKNKRNTREQDDDDGD